MNHVTKPDAGRAASMKNPIAKAAPQIPNLEAVIEIVKGYNQACVKAFTHRDYCNSLGERRNATNTVNAMTQACVSLHIAMLPAAPATCCPTPTIDALSNARVTTGA